MIKTLALALFGWKRTPERFVRRCADYIPICLKQRGVIPADRLPAACRLALSQLAYFRAANMVVEQRPRFRSYVLQLENVSDAVACALTGRDIADERVKSILLFYGVM